MLVGAVTAFSVFRAVRVRGREWGLLLSTSYWAMLLMNSGVAAVFLRSAAAKAVSPGVAASAVHELLGGRRRPAEGIVQLFALLEVVTVALLVAPATRTVAHVITGALGTLFVVMGTAGKLRGSDRPCGCFGIADSKPLGMTNILSGLGFVAVAVAGLSGIAAGGTGTAAETAVLTSAVSSGWLLVTHRDAALTAYRNFLRRWGSA
ncbi:MauE/DoxX family redox-associated membrane protein [Streptomyces sp. NPDC057699]|uniref:MauE/DoxX family redox-associated membrane protein n=1 Tax=Streptomyces sp. NPDC057699 TaxID=3346220 RepID=UPI003687EB21